MVCYFLFFIKKIIKKLKKLKAQIYNNYMLTRKTFDKIKRFYFYYKVQ